MDIHQTQFLGHNRSLSFAGQICGAAEWGASGDRGTWRTTIGDLARSYARVMRMGENDEYYRDQQEDFSPMEGIWENQGLYNYANYTPGAIPVTAPVAYNENLPGLQKLLRGQTSAAGAVTFVDRLLQASTRVESLHRFYDNFQNARYIQYGGFLRELMEFGFEIMRVKPTTTVGSNPAAEWIENLLEGNGSEGNLKLVAEGLAQLFDGFKLNADTASMYEVGDTLDYMGRLVQAAEAVDDVKLDKEVLKASTLSHLVNLGSIYSQLRLKLTPSTIEPDFFLENAWNNSIQKSSNELESFLNRVYSHKNLLLLSNKLLQSLDVLHQPGRQIRDVSFISQMFDWGSLYAAAKDKSLANYKVVDPNGFFRHLWEADQKSKIVYASTLLDELMESIYANTDSSFFNADLTLNPLIGNLSIASFIGTSIEAIAPEFALTTSFDLAKKVPVPAKTPRFPIIIPKGTSRVGLALKALRGLGIAAIIGDILLDAEPVAIDEVYTSIERLKKDGRKDDEGCISGFIIRSSGINAEIGNEYASYVSGSPFDFGVIDKYGNAVKYDGLVQGTKNYVIEAKRRYFTSFFKSDGSPSDVRAATMSKFETQRSRGQTVADNCKLVYSWHFNYKPVADYVEQEWRNNNTLVYWTDYKY
jgi:hypothetical protein